MIDYSSGWGNSVVSTKYICQRIQAIMDLDSEDDVKYHLSRLSDELARNYKVDTGKLIGEKIHKEDCPAVDGFGCRCEEDECRYCGGNCPNDEAHACDGYLGDIDNLYEGVV